MKHNIPNNFLFNGGPLATEFGVHMGFRWPTMQAAINLMLQRGGTTIVETGCQRQRNDWGAGCSTLMFAKVAEWIGNIQVHSIDNDPKHLALSKEVLRESGIDHHVMQHQGDSVATLLSWGRPPIIALLYLDSFDYPYGTLCDLYGGKDDLPAAESMLRSLGDDEIVKRHNDIIAPCQEHCLKELHAAMPRVDANTIILIDDNALPGGGKPRLAKRQLLDWGWVCVMDFQQTLWIKA